jgi:hypothetical protein
VAERAEALTGDEALLHDLEHGRLRRFAEWPEVDLRFSAPGVYTVWQQDVFLYVGISWQDKPGSKGLFGRLDSHASGRRSGDQFCIYICDRYVIPTLEAARLSDVGTGSLSLDRLTRDFVRGQLTYRAVHTATGAEARRIERIVRSTGLPGGARPTINPL